MLRKQHSSYALLVIAILILLIVPKKLQNSLRSKFILPLIPINSFSSFFPKKNLSSPCTLQNKPDCKRCFSKASTARIVYRDPSHWSSFFWIDLGKISNCSSKKIALNSPILSDGVLIGRVDYVGKRHSRVKLITSSSCPLSVRAIRGKKQHQDLIKALDTLTSSDFVTSDETIAPHLEVLKEKFSPLQKETSYHAKGEIVGTSAPLWRSYAPILKGKGFTYNSSDEKGLAKDLHQTQEKELIQAHDLLITTGFDGIFPEGLIVAKVLKVEPLLEGEYSYSLTATPICKDLHDLRHVEVLLPTHFEEEKPPF